MAYGIKRRDYDWDNVKINGVHASRYGVSYMIANHCDPSQIYLGEFYKWLESVGVTDENDQWTIYHIATCGKLELQYK